MNMTTTLGRARTLERALTDLRGIRRARVDISPVGEMTLQVLAVPERSERLLREQIISVVREELGSGSGIGTIKVHLAGHRPHGTRSSRRKLTSLVTRRTDTQFSAQVLLSRAGDVATGEAESPPSRNQARAVAQAVIDGLSDVSDHPMQLQTVEAVRTGGQILVVVSVRFGERFLVGSAEVRFDIPDAVARATLHAMNRSLDQAS